MINSLKPNFVDLIPDQSEIKDDIIYISEKYEVAIHKCICGCGLQVVTSLKFGEWSLIKNQDNTIISLTPSISNRTCKTHYYIIDNKIKIV